MEPMVTQFRVSLVSHVTSSNELWCNKKTTSKLEYDGHKCEIVSLEGYLYTQNNPKRSPVRRGTGNPCMVHGGIEYTLPMNSCKLQQVDRSSSKL